jgi:hypothetical protein
MPYHQKLSGLKIVIVLELPGLKAQASITRLYLMESRGLPNRTLSLTVKF